MYYEIVQNIISMSDDMKALLKRAVHPSVDRKSNGRVAIDYRAIKQIVQFIEDYTGGDDRVTVVLNVNEDEAMIHFKESYYAAGSFAVKEAGLEATEVFEQRVVFSKISSLTKEKS